MSRWSVRVFIVFFCSWGTLTPLHAQSYEGLLKFVPDDANTVALLRVHDFINSPLGVKEDWKKKHETEHLNGGVAIPPWVNVLLRTSYVRPGHGGGDWTSVLTVLPEGIDFKKIAKETGNELQEINSHPVFFSQKRNGYFVQFQGENQERILGGIVPASRQDVSRWISESAEEETTKLDEYLAQAIDDSSSQIILAISMKDMLDPVHIRYRLSGSKALENNTQARTALTLDFQSLQGVRLAVQVKESTQAEIRLDFDRTIGPESEHIKSLLVEFLNDAGSALDELENAGVETRGKSVILTMPLSGESLRRILSLVTSVSPPSASGPQTKTPEPPKPEIEPKSQGASGIDVKASLKYYRAVNHNVDDMEKAYKRINNYRQTAQWHDNFAKRIDELPIENVDPELLDYGQKMSSYLRSLGASLRGMGLKVDALNHSITYKVEQKPMYRNGYDWWYGGAWTAYGPYNYGRPMKTEVDTNLNQVRTKQADIVAKTQPDRDKIWQIINEERSTTRRAMVAKYGSDFQK
ncbi:hypothetical protein [Thalassoglobus polymorphus]|uniref:Uncharacterized protein n=1 Tax=Thalassoglobus polymorphus TaxID=2527994 RepID=A0A517QH07_9PLAN|nr:hypothetical protein [Thalassoglobus polymorphus]QDT30895.1 hypothetical protein Mal48_01240 [Thalassoglobus polymorphus]